LLHVQLITSENQIYILLKMVQYNRNIIINSTALVTGCKHLIVWHLCFIALKVKIILVSWHW